MAQNPYAQWSGTPMSEGAVDALLESSGWGVLAVADGDEPYSIPVSFSYDGDTVVLGLVRQGETDRKFDYVDDGSPARLLVTDVRARFDWQSVAVSGALQRVERGADEWAQLHDHFEENLWFEEAYDEAAAVEGVVGFRLHPDEVHGVEVQPGRD